MIVEDVNIHYKPIDICECDCHVDNKQIMHFMSCCSLTYDKYIRADGEIDFIRWAKHYRKAHK